MSWLWYLAGCCVLALIYDWPWKRKPEQPDPPDLYPPPPPGAPNVKRDRFVHRGGYHNVYWTTGNRNRTRPWIRNIR